MEAAQPLLRWAGSKRQIVPILAGYWNEGFKRYVEPFAGSACLFFHLGPRTALLGDINDELIATYRHVRLRYPEVSKLLDKMRKARREYYKIRTLKLNRLSPARRAARFIYLNRYCFNGLYRTNHHGSFNVPYGGKGSGSLPSLAVLQRASSLLKRATLINGDFEKVLDRVQQGDFVYMDPPFSVSGRRVFKEYDASVFGWKDIIRLRRRTDRLAEMGISFVVSYMDSPEGEYLAKGFNVSVVCVRRNISRFLKSRRKCQELLISNLA
jgi:DNA adenine methylase